MLDDEPSLTISHFASSIMPRLVLESEGDRKAEMRYPNSGFELRLGRSINEKGLDFLY